MMARVYLALGSNVGNRYSHIKNTIALLGQEISNLRISKIYETKPTGYEKQDNFLNAALEGDTVLFPRELLELTRRVEKTVGRVQRFRWGPREIDIDILFYDDLVVVYDDPQLEIPHPRIHERDFVLKPLMDLNENLVHPVHKKTVKQMYNELPKDKRVVLRVYANE